MSRRFDDDSLIVNNIRAHDNVVGRYQEIHGEIYNEIEQDRLRSSLDLAIKSIQSNASGRPLTLDFGCGAGNLTGHLLELGANVISSDISPKFLDLIQQKYGASGIKTHRLNGHDLSEFADNSLDMIATYSVLHHVPDYIAIVKDMLRVIRPGGIIYIDHESSENIWSEPETYAAYSRQMKKSSLVDIRKYTNVYNYIDFFIRKFIDPRYRREGDIHVHADDHIEWDDIRAALGTCVEPVLDKKYLLFKRGYDLELYRKFEQEIADMRVLVVRKK